MTGFSIVSIAFLAICVGLVSCAPAVWSTDSDSSSKTNATVSGLTRDELDKVQSTQDSKKTDFITTLNNDDFGSKENRNSAETKPEQFRNQDGNDVYELFQNLNVSDTVDNENETNSLFNDSLIADNDTDSEKLVPGSAKTSNGNQPSKFIDSVSETDARNDNDNEPAGSQQAEGVPQLFEDPRSRSRDLNNGDQPAETSNITRGSNQPEAKTLENKGLPTEGKSLGDQKVSKVPVDKKRTGVKFASSSESSTGVKIIEEDFGVKDMRARFEMDIADTQTDQIKITSESFPDGDAMKLSDDVIIDALFTNLDILQDNIEMCEEGLRQKLTVRTDHSGPSQTYTSQQASKLISGSVENLDEDDNNNNDGDDNNEDDDKKGDDVENTDKNSHTVEIDDDDDDGGDDENIEEEEKEREVNGGLNDIDRQDMEDSNDDFNDKKSDDSFDVDGDSENLNKTNVANVDFEEEEEPNLEAAEDDGIFEDYIDLAKTDVEKLNTQNKREKYSQSQKTKDDTQNKSKSSAESSAPQTVPSTQNRKRRSTGDNRENSTGHEIGGRDKLPSSIAKDDPKRKHSQASHDVVMRLSNRLHYLKQSLAECYLLYQQISHDL